MAFTCRNKAILFGLSLLWTVQTSTAYLDICESALGAAFCYCEDTSYSDVAPTYRVTCTILLNISRYDAFWRSVGDGDSITYFQVHPRPGYVLDYIPSDELRRMKSLKVLKVDAGTLGDLQAHSVSEIPSLEELELGGNEITSLEPDAISNLPNLKKLTLSDNELQEVLADTLSGLDSLKILYLDRNRISRIEACAFCRLQDLTELELWGNEISDLTEYTFRGLRVIKRLDLYKNKIRVLSDKVFDTMPKLVELDLRENEISYIAPRAFAGLVKLQSLALGKNNIKTLPDDVFVPLESVRFIDLYGNEIEVIQKEVVYGIKNSKNEHFAVGIKENPLHCDCAWQWITSYLKANVSHRFVRELKSARCALDNDTEVAIVDYLKKVDCKGSTIKPRAPPVVHAPPTKRPEAIPNELTIQNSDTKVELSSKTLATVAVADEETEAYLSDVVQKAGMDNAASVAGLCLGLHLFSIALSFTRNRFGL